MPAKLVGSAQSAKKPNAEFEGLPASSIYGLTATVAEMNKLAGVTGGTASASKAVVLGVSKQVSGMGVIEPVVDIAGDGAITIASGVVTLSKGSAAAITIAAPSAAQDGTVIRVVSKSAYAHVVTFTGNTLLDGTSAAKLKATLAAYAGSGLSFVAVGQKWNLLGNTAATLAAS